MGALNDDWPPPVQDWRRTPTTPPLNPACYCEGRQCRAYPCLGIYVATGWWERIKHFLTAGEVIDCVNSVAYRQMTPTRSRRRKLRKARLRAEAKAQEGAS